MVIAAYQGVKGPFGDDPVMRRIIEVIDSHARMRATNLNHPSRLQDAVKFGDDCKQAISPVHGLRDMFHDVTDEDAVKGVILEWVGRLQDVLNYINTGQWNDIEIHPPRKNDPATTKIESVHDAMLIEAKCDFKALNTDGIGLWP